MTWVKTLTAILCLLALTVEILDPSTPFVRDNSVSTRNGPAVFAKITLKKRKKFKPSSNLPNENASNSKGTLPPSSNGRTICHASNLAEPVELKIILPVSRLQASLDRPNLEHYPTRLLRPPII